MFQEKKWWLILIASSALAHNNESVPASPGAPAARRAHRGGLTRLSSVRLLRQGLEQRASIAIEREAARKESEPLWLV
jgi:hypothetical protein